MNSNTYPHLIEITYFRPVAGKVWEVSLEHFVPESKVVLKE